MKQHDDQIEHTNGWLYKRENKFPIFILGEKVKKSSQNWEEKSNKVCTCHEQKAGE